MLFRIPPFQGKTRKLILEKISTGRYSIDENIACHYSKSLIDLLKELLTFDPKTRLAADEALNHHYFMNNTCENSIDSELSAKISNNALKNLMNYKVFMIFY